MIHGFKTLAERVSLQLRSQLALQPLDRLPAARLADHLNVAIVDPSTIPGIPPDVVSCLTCDSCREWSAVAVLAPGNPLIITNPQHSPARIESDIMHELAHILRGHRPGRIERISGFPWPLRTFDPEQEAEAEWLGGCLQIPRSALLVLCRRGYNNSAVAEHYGCSEHMVRYRRNVCGIDAQISRLARFSRARIGNGS